MGNFVIVCALRSHIAFRHPSSGLVSTTAPRSTTRTCRYPGCDRPAVPAEGGLPARPSEYCADPAHNRAAAWRARRAARATVEGRPLPDDMDRPVTMARARAGG